MSFLVIRPQKFYSSTEIVISWYISSTVRGKKSNRCYLYHMCTHVSSRFFFFFEMSNLDLCVNPIEFCFWLILFSYFPNLVIGLSFFLGGHLQVIYYLLPWIVGFALPYACQISYQLMLFTIWFLNLFFMYNFILQKLKI